MDGLLIIDKPAGMTSHDVVSRVRRILKTKKVGHTGTLDPFATGVMVILVGKATRLAQYLDKDEKEYIADIRFGFTTDTGDRTGSAIGETDETIPTPTMADLEAVLYRFRGEIFQTPPMFSAKKVDGKKLYELARKGKTIERQPVKVNISHLSVIENETGPRIRVACSAGTYIRSLAVDIGSALGIGAHLTELRRTRAGKFTLEQAVSLDLLAETESPHSTLLSMHQAVDHLRSLALSDDRVTKTRNGLSTRLAADMFLSGEAIRLTAEDGTLVAIGIYDETETCVRPHVVLI